MNDLKNQLPQRRSDKLIIELIDRIYQKSKKDNDKKSKDLKTNLIFSLYKISSEEYINLHNS